MGTGSSGASAPRICVNNGGKQRKDLPRPGNWRIVARVMTELPKAYEPTFVEEKWQERWMQEKCFHADPHSDKPAYSIVIPPPNVTGVLHMGHVLNNTIQDILARRARQEGKEVLWLPGTDHAGIATQARVEKELARENPPRTRYDVGREDFVSRASSAA